MQICRILRNVIFLFIMLAATNTWAVSSSLWETRSRDDFDAGEPDGISVMPTGEIVLGPKMRITPIDALFAWTLAEDSKGNIYGGTGDNGKIFKVSSKGDAELFAELELQQVFAIAAGGEDVLYAGGFPGGKIYSIDARGAVSEYFDTGQDSVWSLCAGKDGVLFASTGDEGQIFKIEAGGEGNLFYDSTERRILSLICAPDGNLYAGSEQNGIIYKIDPNGHPFVLYDTEHEEVTSMIMDEEGVLFAVSSPGDLFVKIPPRAVPVSAQDGMNGGGVASHDSQAGGPAPSMPAIPSRKKRTCIIYKITQDGVASKFWESPEKLVFSIVSDGTNILAGSGDEGIIYLISSAGEAATYYKAEQKQILALHRTASGQIIGSTGNDATVIFFDDDYVAEGDFFSRVHDATAISKWGRVFWDADVPGQTHVSISTRSGNSEKPDDTWSEWSRGQDASEGFVSESPNGRYIQWHAKLSTSNKKKTPTLRKVTVAYLQSNLAPEVQSIEIETGTDKKKKGTTSANTTQKVAGPPPGTAPGSEAEKGAKASKKGVKTAPPARNTKLKIKWQADDGNGDKLEYELYFKGIDETNWKLLEEKLTKAGFDWDTETVPDGEYHVKVVASDLPDNPAAKSLRGERISEPFMIDNTAPVIESFRAASERDSEEGSRRISCRVSDNLSPVRSAHYSMDAGDWTVVFPEDGIFDSPVEKIEFATGKLEKGEHTLVLKAVDYFGNIGSGKVTFKVK